MADLLNDIWGKEEPSEAISEEALPQHTQQEPQEPMQEIAPEITAPGEMGAALGARSVDQEISDLWGTGEIVPPTDPKVQFEIEKKYRSIAGDMIHLLQIPHQALAKMAVENAPELNNAARFLAEKAGIDVSNWTDVDAKKFALYQAMPEVSGHDFVNLITDADKTSPIARAVLATMADFVDPLLGVSHIFGKAKYIEELAKSGADVSKVLESQTLAQSLMEGDRALFRFFGAEIGLPGSKTSALGRGAATVSNFVKEKANDLVEAINARTGNKLAETARKFTVATETPALRTYSVEYLNDIKGAEFETLNFIRTNSHLSEGVTPAEWEQAGKAFETGGKAKYFKPDIIEGKTYLKPVEEKYAFPNEKSRMAYEVHANELARQEYEWEKFHGTLSKEGKITGGYKPREQEGIPFPVSKRYTPWIYTSEMKSIDDETRKVVENVAGHEIAHAVDMSRTERSHAGIMSKVEEDIRYGVNKALEERGKAPVTGDIFVKDPIKRAAIKNYRQRMVLAKKKFEMKINEIGLTDDEFKAIPESEKYKWEKYELGKKVTDAKAEYQEHGVGQLIDGKYFKKTDLNKINSILDYRVQSGFDTTLNTIRSVTTLWRRLALFSPTYFFGNLIGNTQLSFIDAAKRASLPSDMAKSFSILTNHMRGKLGKTYLIDGKLYSTASIVNEAADHGVLGASRAIEVLRDTGTIGQLNRSLGEIIVNSGNQANAMSKSSPAIKNAFDKIGALGNKLAKWDVTKANIEFTEIYGDNVPRLALYMNYRNAGFSAEEAGVRARETLFHYGDVSQAFGQARKVFPFMTYSFKMATELIPRLMMKYPWLPELTQRISDLYSEKNIDEQPLEFSTLQSMLPDSARPFFTPLITNLLPGKNLLTWDLAQPFSTINAVYNTDFSRIPGFADLALIGIGRDPDSGKRLIEISGLSDVQESPSIMNSMSHKLFLDSIPKPVQYLLNHIPALENYVDNPYLMKIKDRMSRTQMRGAMILRSEDERLGSTTIGFLRRYMPDYFDEVIVKESPEFYAQVGSFVRQHIKDATFGVGRLTNIEREGLLRLGVAKSIMRNYRTELQNIMIARSVNHAPELDIQREKEIRNQMKETVKLMGNIGYSLQVLDNVSRKYPSFEKDSNEVP